jgi:aminoglycoside phosphotransferase
VRTLVAGMVAADPYQGGATWAVLQYVFGLEELGHEVWLVDPGKPSTEAERYFRSLRLGPRAFFGRYRGPAPDLLLNVSGVLDDERILERTPIRVYLDLDPVFTQLWHRQGIDVGLDGHTHHVSVGTRLPRTGHEWIATLPPVVLSRWTAAERIDLDALTTIANFRSYGTIEHEGVRLGQKAHSLRTLVELPRLTQERIALALDSHPDEPDREALRRHGWELIDPREAAGTPERFAAFVRGSKAELGVAKEGYVVSSSGWFSDRSAVYLASGRPVLAQDTGFGDRLPTGAGLFAFADLEGALTAIEALGADYGRHARAARAIAEEYLDSRLVLERLLREVGAAPDLPRSTVADAVDDELAELTDARVLRRRPFEYRSCAPIVELEVDGRTLLLKDLSPGALTARAKAAKLDGLYDPQREIDVYRSLLAQADLGTAELVTAVADPVRGRYWLVIEKVPGLELYQLELDRWPVVMHWLARCHDVFRGVEATDRLVRYDRAFFEVWPARAQIELPGYEAVVERLAVLSKTLVHGDFYPSNVLLANRRVCAVDWELAGVGPGVLDVAALTAGLAEDIADALADEYRCALPDPPDATRFEGDLACARLHLALQWLGWSAEWQPPPEHAHDWRAELPRLAEQAGV